MERVHTPTPLHLQIPILQQALRSKKNSSAARERYCSMTQGNTLNLNRKLLQYLLPEKLRSELRCPCCERCVFTMQQALPHRNGLRVGPVGAGSSARQWAHLGSGAHRSQVSPLPLPLPLSPSRLTHITATGHEKLAEPTTLAAIHQQHEEDNAPKRKTATLSATKLGVTEVKEQARQLGEYRCCVFRLTGSWAPTTADWAPCGCLQPNTWPCPRVSTRCWMLRE